MKDELLKEDTMNQRIDELYINSLYIKNIRRFKEVKIEFNKGLNFLVGPNGSGKTSILRALSMSLSPNAIEDSRVGEGSQVWTDLTWNSKKYRIGVSSGWAKTYNYRQTQIEDWAPPLAEEKIQSVGLGQIDEFIPFYCPLFIGAHRRFNYTQISGMTREDPASRQREKYRYNSAGNLNGSTTPDIKQWLINRYFLIEKDWAKVEKANWEWLIENIATIGPSNSEFSFIGIGRDLEPKFSLFGKETYLEELSAGFQSVLSMILSIFEWIELINDEENSLVKYSKGTVIIDELDVHLHPEWQLTISNSLKTLFPNIQFIITTHSPHVVASANNGEIIIIPKDDEFNVKPLQTNYSGWSTDQILEDIMGVSNLDNKLYNSLIDKANVYFNNRNKEQFKEVVEEIEKCSHPNDTLTSVLKIKLAQLDLKEEEDI